MVQSREEKANTSPPPPRCSPTPILLEVAAFQNPLGNGAPSPLAAGARRRTRDAATVFLLLPLHAATAHRRVRRSRAERPAAELECAEEGYQDLCHCDGSGS